MINKQVKIKVVSSSEELERETSVEFSDIIIWERDRTNINTKEKNGKFECLVTFINKKTANGVKQIGASHRPIKGSKESDLTIFSPVLLFLLKQKLKIVKFYM